LSPATKPVFPGIIVSIAPPEAPTITGRP